MISFNDGDMRFSQEELPEVARDSHAVMQEAIDAGVWVFGGGFQGYNAKHVTAAGDVIDGPLADANVWIGGFSILNLDTDAEAYEWARKIAVSCRCSQEVRRIMDDPEQTEALKNARAARK